MCFSLRPVTEILRKCLKVLLMTVYALIGFIKGVWRELLVGVIASLLVIPVLHLARMPRLELDMVKDANGLSIHGITEPVLALSLRNKNRWTGFGNGDVFIRLFMPCAFKEGKRFFGVSALAGSSERKYEFQEVSAKDNESYCYLEQYLQTPVHPDIYQIFLSIAGDFPVGEQVTFYYLIGTPYGGIPRRLNPSEFESAFHSGELPHVNLQF